MTKFNLNMMKARLFFPAVRLLWDNQIVAIKNWFGMGCNGDILRASSPNDHLLADVEKRMVNTKSYSTLFKESL